MCVQEITGPSELFSSRPSDKLLSSLALIASFGICLRLHVSFRESSSSWGREMLQGAVECWVIESGNRTGRRVRHLITFSACSETRPKRRLSQAGGNEVPWEAIGVDIFKVWRRRRRIAWRRR